MQCQLCGREYIRTIANNSSFCSPCNHKAISNFKQDWKEDIPEELKCPCSLIPILFQPGQRWETPTSKCRICLGRRIPPIPMCELR